jgi:hypothetical protein
MADFRKSIQFKAIASSALIQSRPLPWETPMRDFLKSPETGDFVWRRLHYVFELDDPRMFPHAELACTPEEQAVLSRFVDQARRLAGTTFLGGSDNITTHIPDEGSEDEEVIGQNLADPDITAGYMVFLRQCYADDEEGRRTTGQCSSRAFRRGRSTRPASGRPRPCAPGRAPRVSG